MNGNVVGLGVLPVEVDWSGVDKSLKKQGGGLTSKLGTLGKAAGLALGAGIAGAAVGLFKVGSTFDDAFDTIRVGTGATGAALKDLQQDFREVVKDIPTDFGTASQAIADLNTRTGQTGEGLQELAKRTIEMTRLTGGDLNANIAATTRLFGDWGVETGDQADTLDKLFRASQATGVGIDALSSNMVKFGAPLRQLGFGFEQSVGLLSKFEKEGVNAELVMGSLRIALGKMAREGEPAQETLERTVDAIQNAGSASEANALALELFGARAGPDMAAAIREGRFELGDLLGTIESGEETILGAADDTNDFAESWLKFKNRVLLVLEPIAARVFNALGDGMEKLMSWWDANGPAITGWISDVSGSVRSFVDENLPKVQAFVSDALEALSQWWKTNGPTITTIATGVRDLLATLFDAAVVAVQFFIREWDKIKTPLLAVSGLIVGLLIPHYVALGVVATQTAYTNAKAWVIKSTAALKHGATIIGSIVAQVARWAWMATQALFHAGRIAVAWLISMGPVALVAAAVAGLVALVIIHFDTIKKVISGAWEFVKRNAETFARVFLAVLTGGLSELVIAVVRNFDKIKSAIAGAWETVKTNTSEAIGAVVTYFRELPGKVVSAVTDKASEFLELGKTMVGKIVEGVKSVAGDIGKSIMDAIPGAGTVGNALGGVGGALSGAFKWATGDGPGAPSGPLAGGNTLAKVQSIIGQYPGARVSSTYRTPARNKAVGGSPTSYHLDRLNPAVDIVAPSAATLDAIHARLKAAGRWRELLWRVPNHAPGDNMHIHVAHTGGYVTPQGITPLRSDELLTKLQVGETVFPKGASVGGNTTFNITAQSDTASEIRREFERWTYLHAPRLV